MTTTTIVIIATPLPLPEHLDVVGTWLQAYLQALHYTLSHDHTYDSLLNALFLSQLS